MVVAVGVAEGGVVVGAVVEVQAIQVVEVIVEEEVIVVEEAIVVVVMELVTMGAILLIMEVIMVIMQVITPIHTTTITITPLIMQIQRTTALPVLMGLLDS